MYRPRKRPEGRRRPLPPEGGGKAVFSYRSTSRIEPAQHGRHQTGKSPLLPRLPRYIVATALIVWLVFISTLTPNPVITNLSTSSDALLLRPPGVYQQAAVRILSDSIWDHSKITIDSAGFERTMKTQFPELSEATITLPFVSRRPHVTLVARQPALSLVSQQGVYLLDAEGRAIIKAVDVASVARFKLQTVTDESNLPVQLGKGILTSQEVIFVEILSSQLKAGGIPIQTISLTANVNELRVRITAQPYFVKFDMQNDPRTSAGALIALKQRLDSDHITPTQYIDLRLDERAAYK